MKKFIIAAASLTVAVGSFSCQGTTAIEPKSTTDSISVAVGASLASQFAMFSQQAETQGRTFNKQAFVDAFASAYGDTTSYEKHLGLIIASELSREHVGDTLNADLFVAALKARFLNDSADIKLADEDIQSLFSLYQQKKREQAQRKYEEEQKKREAEAAEKAKGNIEKGKAFATEFKTQNPSAQTTESGLVYIIEKDANGAAITASSTVKLNYRGTLIDGTEFDKGEGVEFSPEHVVPGFREILLLMKVGQKVKVVIPSELAYGNQDLGQIAPGSTLVFEIEVLEVK